MKMETLNWVRHLAMPDSPNFRKNREEQIKNCEKRVKNR